MKSFLFFLVINMLIISGCTKEEMTLYYAYFKNSTAHKIEFRPYFGGLSPLDKRIILMSNDSKEIANGFYRGIGNEAIFLSSYMTGADSLVVIFDDLYSITHYGNAPALLNPKHYLFTNNRNIGNSKNYRLETTDFSKFKKENRFTYEFIEQDYLDAR